MTATIQGREDHSILQMRSEAFSNLYQIAPLFLVLGWDWKGSESCQGPDPALFPPMTGIWQKALYMFDMTTVGRKTKQENQFSEYISAPLPFQGFLVSFSRFHGLLIPQALSQPDFLFQASSQHQKRNWHESR